MFLSGRRGHRTGAAAVISRLRSRESTRDILVNLDATHDRRLPMTSYVIDNRRPTEQFRHEEPTSVGLRNATGQRSYEACPKQRR